MARSRLHERIDVALPQKGMLHAEGGILEEIGRAVDADAQPRSRLLALERLLQTPEEL